MAGIRMEIAKLRQLLAGKRRRTHLNFGWKDCHAENNDRQGSFVAGETRQSDDCRAHSLSHSAFCSSTLADWGWAGSEACACG